MLTIDLITETTSLAPTNWTQVASSLGISSETVKKCRRDLGRSKDRLTPELYEEIRRMAAFCRLRGEGGGANYTRTEYMKLKNRGQDILEAKLRADQII